MDVSLHASAPMGEPLDAGLNMVVCCVLRRTQVHQGSIEGLPQHPHQLLGMRLGIRRTEDAGFTGLRNSQSLLVTNAGPAS